MIATSTMPVITAAKGYLSQGWSIVPDKPQSKEPSVLMWPTLKLGLADVEKYFSADSNISILLGGASNGLVCVDIDHPMALRVVELLPKTNRVHGRAGMPKSHYWYLASGTAFPSAHFKHPNGTMLVEMLGDKRKMQVPPSVHESGEQISWDVDGDPAHVELDQLRVAVARTAGAAMLGMSWPKKGSRNEAALALAGMLLRAGWSVSDATLLIRVAARAAGDDEHEKRGACAKDTAGKVANGEPVTGAARLSELIGADVVSKLKEWLSLAASGDAGQTSLEDRLADLNKRHAVIRLGGSTVILNEGYDPAFQRPTVTFGREADFNLLLKNRQFQVPDLITGKPKMRSAAQLWLGWPGRRQYEGIEFNPTITTAGYYNLFKGLPVKPMPGDCDLYLEHAKKVVCAGDTAIFDWVIRWMAHSIQRPGERPETALVLRGLQGTGKGVFVDLFGELFEPHFLTLYSHAQVTGRFNGHLNNVLLLSLSEAIWGGQKDAAGMLKGLITDPTIAIEAKGKDIFRIRNFMRVIVSSNEAWAVPADADDRRFLILDVSAAHKEDHAYFAKLLDQMKNKGGLAALMHHLLHVDLEGFNVRKAPVTPYIFDIKLKSADNVTQWWFEQLKEGPEAGWVIEPIKQVLHGEYVTWCNKHKMSHPLTIELFAKQLKKLVPGMQATKPKNKSFNDGIRIPCFKFPPLEQCREAFEQLMKAGAYIWE